MTDRPVSPVEVKTPFGGLRSWRAEDAPAVAVLASDRRIARNLRDALPHPYTLEDAHAFLAAAAARVLEKAGYRKEGTLRRSAIKEGQVLDRWMYALLRDELHRIRP